MCHAGPNETRTCGIEDPSLWVDRNGIVHAIVHNWKAGGHAASADPAMSDLSRHGPWMSPGNVHPEAAHAGEQKDPLSQ